MSLRDKILKNKNLEQKKVHVPEWGVDVYVRMLTAGERDLYEQEIVKENKKNKGKPNSHIRARLVMLSTIDENGGRVFKEEDIEELAQMGIKPIERLFEVSQNLNALTEDDVKALEKN